VYVDKEIVGDCGDDYKRNQCFVKVCNWFLISFLSEICFYVDSVQVGSPRVMYLVSLKHHEH